MTLQDLGAFQRVLLPDLAHIDISECVNVCFCCGSWPTISISDVVEDLRSEKKKGQGLVVQGRGLEVRGQGQIVEVVE